MRWLLAALLALVLAVAGGAPPGADASGVVARGTDASGHGRFVLDGSPWVSTGWNDYRIMHHPVIDEDGYGACGDQVSAEDFSRQMDRIQATGANTVRTWFFQEYYADAPSNDRWRAFDRLLQGARNRGLKVVPVLSNEWPACDRADDSFDTPAKDREGTLDAGFYTTGYKQPQWGYDHSLKEWARMVARRYDPDSGFASTIAYFQIVNEGEPLQYSAGGTKTCPSNAAQVFRGFADDMAGAIKDAYLDGVAGRQAPLVSLGTMGIGQCGQTAAPAPAAPGMSEYAYIHAGDVDLCELHDYDAMNEAWPQNVYGLPGNGFAGRLADCGAKPLVIGEAGIKTDVTSSSKSTQDSSYDQSQPTTTASLRLRAQFFASKMDAALNQNAVDGYQVWDKFFLRSTDRRNTDPSLNRGDNYGVGAPGDPTTCVFRAFTPASNCPAPGPDPPVGSPDDGAIVHYGFEEDQGGWKGDWPSGNLLSTGRTTYKHHEGSSALAIGLTASPSQKYAGVATYSGTGGLDSGTTVSMWFYNDPDTSGVKVQPFVKDLGYATSFGSITTLTSGWRQVTFTVPTVDAVSALGFQVLNEQGKTGGIQMDEVVW